MARAGIAAAVLVAALGGFVAAGLIVGGEKRIRERFPVALGRAWLGGDVGRAATSPAGIPLVGWWEILRRTAILFATNRLMTEAAAITFYTLLALFPALTAIVSFYGLFADPEAITRLLGGVSAMLPSGGVEILRGQLHKLVARGSNGLSLGAAVGLAGALWSANQGSKALFDALNVIYRETEKRSYALFVVIAMGFTFSAILFVIAAMAAVVVLPVVLDRLGLGDQMRMLYLVARWPTTLVVVGLFLSFVYRFGPSRDNAKWRWVTPGGGLAAVSWVFVSVAFSWYVRNYGSFDATYGSLGALVGFLTWIWLSTLVVLAGAQLNSELEHQTATDTTTGRPRLLGLRGAIQADTVA